MARGRRGLEEGGLAIKIAARGVCGRPQVRLRGLPQPPQAMRPIDTQRSLIGGAAGNAGGTKRWMVLVSKSGGGDGQSFASGWPGKMGELLKQAWETLGWVNVVTALLVGLAGWTAWKKTIASTSQEIYERVAAAYKAEVEALQERMRLLEQENERLHDLLANIKRSLSRRGLRVTEDGEVERKRRDDGDGGR